MRPSCGAGTNTVRTFRLSFGTLCRTSTYVSPVCPEAVGQAEQVGNPYYKEVLDPIIFDVRQDSSCSYRLLDWINSLHVHFDHAFRRRLRRPLGADMIDFHPLTWKLQSRLAAVAAPSRSTSSITISRFPVSTATYNAGSGLHWKLNVRAPGEKSRYTGPIGWASNIGSYRNVNSY